MKRALILAVSLLPLAVHAQGLVINAPVAQQPAYTDAQAVAAVKAAGLAPSDGNAPVSAAQAAAAAPVQAVNNQTGSVTVATPSDGGAPVSAAQAASQISSATASLATSSALSNLAATIPQPASTAPANPAPTAAKGSSSAYMRADSVVPTLCRRTTVTSASDGSFSVTWATPLISSTPWGHVEPIYTGATMPPVCWMRSISATAITGQCSPTQTTALSTAIVTTGITVNPFGANTGAASLTVKVSSCEPTQ